ncbi:energy transducer TonB [Brevundimonas viscosa]|uniref:TonB family C-terminal domain-containing protein n=1 Tax=Brevundimonas viscosa TaxID=871741 RepID=A0A1I6NQD4_9CAUL|nr:TonB family protein [Brevundimonas viscosa]SFS30144.1 TonB family C-terminal domain-containing protein [Brevundimonas viscosa]
MSTRGRLRPTVAVGAAVALAVAGGPAWAQADPASAPRLYVPEAAASCSDQPVTPVFSTSFVPLGPAELRPGLDAAATGLIEFSVDAAGRPVDIVAPAEANTDVFPNVREASEATFAAWRFAPGPREGCRLRMVYSAMGVATAPASVLAAYFGGNRRNGPLRDAVRRRLAGEDASCEEGAEARSYAVPNFDAPGKRPGVQDWSVVRWSVADGRVRDVEIVASSGSPPFDAEVARATGQARLAPGAARTGCVYNWYRRGLTLPAPAMPPPPSDGQQHCPAAVLADWRPQALAGPEAFRMAGVEGWALVRFDIAPWGEVGNVRLIGAQPARAFGEAAMNMVRRGRAAPGEGAVGCVQPVEFRIAD